MAQKRPNLVLNLHFWSFRAKYCHFLHILSNARPKTNSNKVAGWVFRYVGNKTFDFSSKNKDFLPKIGSFGQFWPGHAGLFSALLVVVARGLYLARHLFTLFHHSQRKYFLSGSRSLFLQELCFVQSPPITLSTQGLLKSNKACSRSNKACSRST